MRPLLALVLALAAAAGVYVLMADGPDEPAATPEDLKQAQDDTETTTLQGTGVETKSTEPENPYENVTDWEKLGRGLWLNSDRANAVKRVVALLRGKPDEIRKLIRRMHPDAGESQHSGQSIFHGVAQTLVKLGTQHLDLLLEELDDENAVYRTRVVALIGSFEKAAGPAVPALLERFHALDEDPPGGEVASYINAFRAIGPAAKDVLPVLERWIDEGATPEVETAALRALAHIAGPTDAVLDRLIEVQHHDGWPQQRWAALGELCLLGAKAAPVIPRLLALVDEGVLDEGAAMNALAHIGVPHPDVLARAEKGLRATPETWEGLGVHAFTLAKLGDEGLRRLMAYVDEKGPYALAKLGSTLKQAGFDHDDILRRTRAALTAEEGKVRQRVWMEIAELKRLTPGSVEADLLFGFEDADADVREIVIHAASVHGMSAPAVVKALLRRAEDAQERPQLRLNAIELLTNRKDRPERLYNAVLALHRTAGPDLNAAFYLHPWLEERPAVVLALWAKSTPNPRISGRMYGHHVRSLPVRVRRQHADVIRKLGLDPETGKLLDAAR